MARRGRKNRGQEEADHVTIKGRLAFPDSVSKAKVLYTMRLFRDAVEKAFVMLKRELPADEIRRRLTRFLNNAHYAVSALTRAKMYEKQERLKLRKPQLYSIGSSTMFDKGNRNIRLVATDKVKIKVPRADGRHEWVECTVKFGKKHLPLVEELLRGDIAYSASVVFDAKRNKYYLHVTVPVELYVKYFPISPNNRQEKKYIAAFDLNPDRICMVIVDRTGLLREIRNEHLSNVVNLPGNSARDIRQKALKRLVEYAVEHNVGTLLVEDLERSNTKTKNKSANRKISRFAFRQYMEHLKVLAKRAGLEIKFVNPAYTSIVGKILAKDFGLDVHTCSAYALALKFVRK